MADPITVVHAIYILVREFNLTVEKARCSKRRLRHLLDRVSWFADKFAEIEKTRALKDSDLKVINDFKTLLEEIVQFTSSLNGEGWVGRMWKANSNDDAIDDFNVRLENARNDLIFIFTTDTPLPKAWAKGDEEDWHEMLQLLKSPSANKEQNIERELALAKLNREEIVQRLQRKFNESVTESESYDWQENLVSTSFGSVLKAADFRPDLHKLSKDRFPTLVIGEGTFGTVFKCQWRGDIVAVKILKVQTLSKRALSQLSEEVRIMYSLGAHRNVVNIYGLVVDPGRCLCLVMNFASRGSLRQNLDLQANQAPITPQGGALAEELWRIRWRWAYEIASGMAWLHSANPPIIHRDLKSDNVLMDEDGRLLVSDFGCAIAKSETISRTTGAETVAAGSIPWMPPEAFSQYGKQGAEGDVYAYAVVLWEILTRDIPWCGVHPSLIPALVQGGQRPLIPEPVLARAHPEFVSLIKMCWDQTASSRPPFAFVKSKLANMFSLATPTAASAAAQAPSFRLRPAPRSHHLNGTSSQMFSPRVIRTPGGNGIPQPNLFTPRGLITPTGQPMLFSPRLSVTPSVMMPRFSPRFVTPNASVTPSMGNKILSPLRTMTFEPKIHNSSTTSTPQSTASFSFESLTIPSKSPRPNGPLVSPAPRSRSVIESPPIVLESTGIPGVCEWLRKSSACDLAEITVLPTDLIQTKQLLEAILRSDENNADDLARILNPHRDDEGGTHLVAGAVKEYFRGRAEPITTFALYPMLLQLGQAHPTNSEALAKELGDVFTRIPEPYFTEFRSLIKFLHSIRTVNSDQLAQVWAPHLVWTQAKNKEYMVQLGVTMRLVHIAIDKYTTVFELTRSLASTTSANGSFSSHQQQLQHQMQLMDSKQRSKKKLMSRRGSSLPLLGASKSSKDLPAGNSCSTRQLNHNVNSSSTASMSSQSGSFRRILTKPFSSGLTGFVRVFPPGAMSSALPEETPNDIDLENSGTGIVGVDPVSKVKLTANEVYARDGNICFQSTATQNHFYKMLDSGFTFKDGELMEGAQQERVWTLCGEKGEFEYIGGGADSTTSRGGTSHQISLDIEEEGKYTFHASVTDCKEKRLFASKCKGVVALFQIISSGMGVEEMEFVLNPQQNEPSLTFPFQITRDQTPCIVKVSFVNRHRRRKFALVAHLDKVATPQHRLEVEKARKSSQSLLQENEFIVEFEKDAFGLGISVAWDENQQAIVVKSLEPEGAAARNSKIEKGDIICAVQGQRVNLMDHHEVGQLLRNIPLVVVLVIRHPSRRAYSLVSYQSSSFSSAASSSNLVNSNRSLMSRPSPHRMSIE